MKEQIKKKTSKKNKEIKKEKKVYPEGNIPYKSLVKQEEKPEVKLTKSQIDHIITHTENLEEFFFFIELTKDKELDNFMTHSKKDPSLVKSKNRDITNLLKRSKNSTDLKSSLKEKLVSFLKEEYDTIKKTISEKRKQGLYVNLIDIKSLSIPLKIKIFSATSNKKDFYAVKKQILETEKQLKSVEKTLIKKTKKEK